MRNRSSRRLALAAAGVQLALASRAVLAQASEPIVYTVTAPSPETHVVRVEAAIPTGGRATVELMLPVWTPGFYRVEDHAARVRELTARAPDGAALRVERPRPNRWRVHTGGRPGVVVSYRLLADGRTVTTSWIGPDLAVLNGASAFLTLAGGARRPHEVRLEPPAGWRRVMTALEPAPGGLPNRFRAADYDELVDSPILAGDLSVHEFEVGGARHYLVDAGDTGGWDGRRAAADLAKAARATLRLWGTLPFERYLFLNVFRPGGGGLEHRNSTLVTASAERTATPEGYRRWLGLASHEYFHAFNVKRLRPVELGPFDYERPPRTRSLWISEGLTSYYGSLLLVRGGADSLGGFLAALSHAVRTLQGQPGRLVQSLEQSSWEVWSNSHSGIDPGPATVSYYVKGEVAGFLLDARIRRETGGRKSLDDLMRLAYARYSGERGFTPEQFQAAAAEVAGVPLDDWFREAVASPGELDYTDALDWYGLRFAPSGGPAERWTLQVRPDATEAQKRRLAALVSG